MPHLQIHLDSPTAVYRQIVDGLRTRLVEGELQPGEALPSVRRLALELGITFNTVALAYRELAEEGWIDLRHGRRATVARRLPRKSASRDQMQLYRQRLRELIAQWRAEGANAPQIALELQRMAAKLEEA